MGVRLASVLSRLLPASAHAFGSTTDLQNTPELDSVAHDRAVLLPDITLLLTYCDSRYWFLVLPLIGSLEPHAVHCCVDGSWEPRAAVHCCVDHSLQGVTLSEKRPARKLGFCRPLNSKRLRTRPSWRTVAAFKEGASLSTRARFTGTNSLQGIYTLVC